MMKTIYNYITEKLKLTKDISVAPTEFDGTNAKMLEDIIKAAFIYIYRDRVYKIVGLSTYSIKRSEVKYDEIINILNNEYNYAIDEDEGQSKKSEISTFIRRSMESVQALVNFKTIRFHAANSDKEIVLKGKDIYWNDWKEYREKHNLTGY